MIKGHDCNKDGHIGKVAKMEYKLEDGDVKQYVALWGCTNCDATSVEQWADFGVIKPNPDHKPEDADCLCFGCKAKGLQLATGDAAGNIIASGTTQKKWDKELQLYRDAKAQGVQPGGTSTKAIREAMTASEVLNKPYDAGRMPTANKINKETASVMKEIGQI
jgi:hypothetical protein